MEVLELKGMKGYRAFQAFHKLMLGLKMIPAYLSESYEDFFNRASEMGEDDQERLIREAILFVDLEQYELEALLGHCPDPNGIPYTSASIKNLDPSQLVECMVAVCKTIIKIRVDFVGDAQKKSLKTSQ